MTISAILVAWSATRSMKREMRMSRMARGMVLGSSIMKVRSSRKSCSLRASTSASSAHTLRASSVSRATKASRLSLTMCWAFSAMRGLDENKIPRVMLALLERDDVLAQEVIARVQQVNAYDVEVDETCVSLH